MKNLRFASLLIPCFLLLPACGDAGDPSFADDSGTSSSGGDGSWDEGGSATDTGAETGASSSSGDGSTTGTGDGGDDTGTTGGDDTGGFVGGDGDGDSSSSGDGDSGDGDGDGDACDLDLPVTLYLSPDDSNSMASPAQVKQVVAGTGIPSLSALSIRPWEFMNYYTFDYDPAPQGELALSVEMVEGEADGEFRMQIAVTSESMTQAQRPPMNVTLVLDTSGSMGGQPMAHMVETAKAIAASLKPGDKVSLLEWDTETTYKLAGYAVSGPNDATLLEKIGELQAGGGTDLSGGLETGYDLAQQSFDTGYINRLVLISDGGANTGITDEQIIAENAGAAGEDGIYMVGVGVADGSYNDYLMDTVTDLGKGASVFVHDEAEAWKMFNQNFVNTMAIAARDVRVQLDMPPGYDIVKFSGEEFSGDPTEIEPQHISPNDSMVFHQVIANCDPESVSMQQEFTFTVTYQDAWTFENKSITQTFTIAELLETDPTLLHKGRAVLAYADAVALIRDEPYAKEEHKTAAMVQINYAQSLLPDDPDLVEIAATLEAL